MKGTPQKAEGEAGRPERGLVEDGPCPRPLNATIPGPEVASCLGFGTEHGHLSMSKLSTQWASLRRHPPVSEYSNGKGFNDIAERAKYPHPGLSHTTSETRGRESKPKVSRTASKVILICSQLHANLAEPPAGPPPTRLSTGVRGPGAPPPESSSPASWKAWSPEPERPSATAGRACSVDPQVSFKSEAGRGPRPLPLRKGAGRSGHFLLFSNLLFLVLRPRSASSHFSPVGVR
ncbi:hypothetical protein DBR06_SOUSAS28710013 [Sousa chinensis]|uniref:Uncharacterized protein n=1 Tax=Sousa chinensis TaxID=103600 RepID=A0A484H011_SOUCH|nr:hypothetical protein DBR06_SOUSAS28710013 [Sousa chinensis]